VGPINYVFDRGAYSHHLVNVIEWYVCMIRYDTRCYFNVRSKAGISRLNVPHGNDN